MPKSFTSIANAQEPGFVEANQAQSYLIEHIQYDPNSFQIARELLPPTSQALTLSDVMASVYQSFPLINSARLDAQVFGGEQRSAIGAWDPKLDAATVNQPLSYYKNYQHSVGLARNTWWGGYLSSGYRIARGSFEPWYKERETDKGGEFKVAWVQPLLEGFAIDPNRVVLFQANVRQQSVGPRVQREILHHGLDAAIAYWSWVAAGQNVRVQEELLRLAQVRMQQIRKLIDAGDLREATFLFNSQLIAEREFKLLETIRKLRETSFKLSLYLRDENGNPMVPEDAWLPPGFPTIGDLPAGDFARDIAAAVQNRPELRLLELDARQFMLELDLARNQRLPRFDFFVETSKDVGDPATPLGDKSPFEADLGFQGSVPLPRNKALGKIQSTQAKLSQIALYRQFQYNKFGIELQTQRNALAIATQRVKQAEATVRIAVEYLELMESMFYEGEGELLDLNILETKTYDARFYLVEAQLEWFQALAAFQAAMGLDPLEQSIRLAELAPPQQQPLPRIVAPQGHPAEQLPPAQPGN